MSKRSPQFNLRLEPKLRDWLAEKAQSTRLSRTWIVNDLIQQAMHNEQQLKSVKEEALDAATPRASETQHQSLTKGTAHE
ncbi:hypothetical protein ACIGG6_03635 [Vreelandella lionensis]|uniref:Ribbon-helix-helix protein CopG domain-containing protein n=1 Tax=Vreelandella lionensis TaxID=1144478 RepID=A0ABW8BPF0_9GAMM